MPLRDWTFEKFFQSAFIYNILWEDTEVDETILNMAPGATVLAISGAGCGIANHISRHAERIDAVDINPHHLALTALKCAGARHIADWQEFYALFGHGHHPQAKRLIRQACQELPPWIQAYWRLRWRIFADSMVASGLTARMLGLFRNLAGLNAEWLRKRMTENLDQRHIAVEWAFRELCSHRFIPMLLQSPVHLVALGMNFAQRDRLLAAEDSGILPFFEAHMKRLIATDLACNWYAWYAAAGHFNHDRADAVPPYLRQDHHERSRASRTAVNYHKKNIFAVLGAAGPRTWSHYTFCDAIDWMPFSTQRRLFDEVLRTSRDGAKVLYRSVEAEALIARHGLNNRFIHDRAASEWATRNDRSRQYRRVDIYTVAH